MHAVVAAQRVHVSERTYYALMQSGKQYAFSKRGQIILKVLVTLLILQHHAVKTNFS